MAQIYEEVAVLKLSKLVKNVPEEAVLTPEIVSALEQMLSEALAEITGDTGMIVELETGA